MEGLLSLATIVRRAWQPFSSSSMIVLALGAGLGVSVSVYSVLHGVISRSLPYPDADRIVVISSENPERNVPRSGMTAAEAQELSTIPGFASAGYYRTVPAITITSGESPVQLGVRLVSRGYLETFGVRAEIGRSLVESDFSAGSDAALLNYAAWTALGRDPDIVGTPLFNLDSSFHVVGVLPADFNRGAAATIYGPTLPPDADGYYGARRLLFAYARLEPDVSLSVASSALNLRLAAVNEGRGSEQQGWQYQLVPLLDEVVGGVRPMLLALFGLSVLVLSIACFTTMPLISARTRDRSVEYSIRAALGAPPSRLVMQVVAELLVLAGVAFGLGLFIALIAIWLVEPLAGAALPRADDIQMSLGPLLFAFTAAAASVLLCTFAPLRTATRLNVARELRTGTQSEVRGKAPALLAITSVALSIVAVVASLAVTVSLLRLSAVELGFRTENIVALFMVRQPQPQAADQFLRDVLDELRNTPGVNGAAAVLAGVPTNVGMIQAPVQVDGQEVRASLQAASANYHGFMGITIIRGRDISSLDSQEAPRVVVINETLSRSAFRGSDPIGRIITLSNEDYEVIGVAADRKNAGVRAPTQPEFVVSIHQWPGPAATVLIDYPYDELPGWRGVLQDVVWRVNPSQAITQSVVLADDLASQTKPQQFFATATAVFAGLALCLAISGINSIVSSRLQQRRREIGLRLALGAKPHDSRTLIYRDALRLVLPGLIVGALLVIPLAIFLLRSLFTLTELDMFAFFAAAAFVLALGSAFATFWPAVTAGRIEPMAALRHE